MGDPTPGADDRTVYLDHHATTPVDPRVLDAMLPFLTTRFGNAASRQHQVGLDALEAVEVARQQVAGLVGASPKEVVFTSGATESLNLALKGLFDAEGARRDHIVTTAVEHSAVLDTCESLARRGATITVLPVGPGGRVDPDAARRALTDRTLAVAVMAANNEVGTLQPLEAIGGVCAEAGVPLVTDAAQMVGKLPFDRDRLGASLVALSAHKLYGPKGVGALVVRRRPRVDLRPQLHGGGHERGLRSGTLNVPGIVGLGVACALAADELATEAPRLAALRDRLLAGLREGIGDLQVNGSLEHRLPNNLNVTFPGVEARRLLEAVPDVAVSSGAACTTAQDRPSHVLRALGLDDRRVYASIRMGLGRTTDADDIELAVARLTAAVTMLRGA